MNNTKPDRTVQFNEVNHSHKKSGDSIPARKKPQTASKLSNGRSNSVVSMRDITPEIAAQVVKNYLLPMFDSDGKKYLTKRSKSKVADRSNTKNDGLGDINTKPKTIYDELKVNFVVYLVWGYSCRIDWSQSWIL